MAGEACPGQGGSREGSGDLNYLMRIGNEDREEQLMGAAPYRPVTSLHQHRVPCPEDPLGRMAVPPLLLPCAGLWSRRRTPAGDRWIEPGTVELAIFCRPDPPVVSDGLTGEDLFLIKEADLACVRVPDCTAASGDVLRGTMFQPLYVRRDRSRSIRRRVVALLAATL